MANTIFEQTGGTYTQVGDYMLPDLLPAEEMFSRLVKQMAMRESVTEQLKADNQMAWVGRMNNIRSRATEVVNTDLIYT
ncbi:TnpV protein [Ruminococcus bromii]|jgi:hypothetical protein|uniref:TnpV protein n=1 Tax=Ruminococcus bromii TaxID=40518 RepID=UPI0026ED7045|nr:TnpV protein [Ruminococcus bromii]